MSTAHRNVEQVATFTDKYGDERRIYREGQRGKLRAEKPGDTVSHLMNRAVAVLVGASIKRRRIAAGLTLEDLCTRAGLRSETPKHRMWEIETAAREHGTRMGTLYALARALGCTPQDLMPTMDEVLAKAGIRQTEKPVLEAVR